MRDTEDDTCDSLQFHVASALGFAVEAKVVEILRPAESKGLHANEIAEKAKVNPNKLGTSQDST